MIHPKIDDLLEKVDSKYALVIAAARRTRQINDYHHQLGEGSFESFAPPLVESRSKNFLTMALEEIAQGQLKVSPTTKEEPAADEVPGRRQSCLARPRTGRCRDGHASGAAGGDAEGLLHPRE